MLRALTSIAAGSALLAVLAGPVRAQTPAEIPPLTQLWGSSVDGPSHLDDLAADVDVGSDGSIYAAGTVNADGNKGWLGKFGAGGDLLWSGYFPGKATGVAAATDGYVYVTGTASRRMYVKKFAPVGCVSWTRSYPGRGLGVAVSPSGRAVYVTGSLAGDIVVRKISSTGVLLWTRTFNGRADAADEGRKIAVDRSENLYVAGYVRTPLQGMNLFLRKYSPSGRVRWTREVRGASGGNDWANGVTLDALGNVYLAGVTTAAGREYILARAYTAQGQLLWENWWEFTQYLGTRGSDVAVGSNGIVNIIGTGTTPAGSSQPFLLRLGGADGAVIAEYDFVPEPLGIGTGNGIVATADGFAASGSLLQPPGEGGNDLVVYRFR